MTTGTAKFYKMKGGLSSGEYPLFATNQNLSSYLKSTATVKYSKGLQTSITVPTFTGYESVNVVDLDGSYYWATSFRESTTYNGSVEYVLDYMAPTSLIRTGQSITGTWKKTPTQTRAYMNEVISNDVMQESRYAALPKLGTMKIAGTSYPYFWYQIVGYDANNMIKRFGGFMAYNQAVGLDVLTLLTAYNIDSVKDYVYPSYADLIENITTYTGILAENIMDFSISERCPYPNTKTVYSSTRDMVKLNVGTPTTVYSSGTVDYVLYDLTATSYGTFSGTATLTLTEMERRLGQITVKDSGANNVMSIPTSLASSVTLNVSTFADVSGIYTVLSHGDQKITFREGQLPYLGNTWETYRAYQLDTDMTQLQYNFANTKYQLETDLEVARSNAIIGGIDTVANMLSLSSISPGAKKGVAVGAATSAVGSFAEALLADWQANRNARLKDAQARQDFDLSQKRAINQPQTAYNNGYGTVYCHDSANNTSRMCLLMPSKMDSTYYNAWNKQFGYSSEGVLTITASNGYYQGQLINDGSIVGMYFDELNQDFNRGFRFITIT